jgi:hypothetical protein
MKHSKTYRYELGHVWFKAATVGDLQEYLKGLPQDMPVIVTWEGTVHSLTCPEVIDFHGGKALQFDAEYDITNEELDG